MSADRQRSSSDVAAAASLGSLDALRRSIRRRWLLAAITGGAVLLNWVIRGGEVPWFALALAGGIAMIANAAAAQSVSRQTVEAWAPLFSPAADLAIVLSAVAITGAASAPLLLLLALIPHALDNDPRIMDLLVVASVLGYLGLAWVHAVLVDTSGTFSATAMSSVVTYAVVAWPLVRGAAVLGKRLRMARGLAHSLTSFDLTGYVAEGTDDVGRLTETLNILGSGWSTELRTLHTDLERSDEEVSTATAGVEELRTLLSQNTSMFDAVARELERQRTSTGRLWERSHVVAAALAKLQSLSTEIQADRERVEQALHRARSTLERVTQTLVSTREAVATSATSVDDLALRSKKIGDTAESLGDMARQTHVLALNAAIEAAQSDAAGDSFAVVADEIHALAGVAGQTVRDAVQLIDGLKADIESAAHAVKSSTGQLDAVSSLATDNADALAVLEESLGALAGRVTEIPDATREQEPQVAAMRETLQESSTTLENALDRAQTASADPHAALDQLRARLSLASGRLRRALASTERFKLRQAQTAHATLSGTGSEPSSDRSSEEGEGFAHVS